MPCLPGHHKILLLGGPGLADTVGANQGAVQADVLVPGGFGRQQRVVQVRA
jgi:hypothetical protein